jgi:hypothetical protein
MSGSRAADSEFVIVLMGSDPRPEESVILYEMTDSTVVIADSN